MVFSPDGTRIATVGGRGILLQNVYTGWRWFRPLEPRREKLTAFAFNSSGFEMAVGLRVHPDAIRMSANGKRNRNGHRSAGVAIDEPAPYSELDEEFKPIVRLWDLREDRYVDLLAGDSSLRELSYSPDNRLLAGVDETGWLRLWEIPIEGSINRPPQLLLQLDLGLTGRKIVVSFTPDNERLICATDNRILLWNLVKLRQEAARI